MTSIPSIENERAKSNLFYLYLRLYLLELVLHLHKTIFTQLDQLPRFADLHERFLKIDLLLLFKPIRDLLDVLQILF